MKKIVIFGGGTGLSCILHGLKLFPLDVTAVIAVSDDGSSAGVLREELDIPAVGDLGKVLLAMANVDDDFVKLLRYRFEKEGSLKNHPVRNVLLAALIDLKGNLTEATKYMSQLLQVKGTVLPITEEKVDLVGHGKAGDYYGESEVSRNVEKIERLTYDHPVEINPEIPKKIAEADLIVLSPGSLYTSTLPHLIIPDIQRALEKADAPIMYIANLGTQPGETDGDTVSDHIAALNRYLGERKVDVVIANEGDVDRDIAGLYQHENKSVVDLDRYAVEHLGVEVITDDIMRIGENGRIRHDELKTAYLVFSYLMR